MATNVRRLAETTERTETEEMLGELPLNWPNLSAMFATKGQVRDDQDRIGAIERTLASFLAEQPVAPTQNTVTFVEGVLPAGNVAAMRRLQTPLVLLQLAQRLAEADSNTTRLPLVVRLKTLVKSSVEVARRGTNRTYLLGLAALREALDTAYVEKMNTAQINAVVGCCRLLARHDFSAKEHRVLLAMLLAADLDFIPAPDDTGNEE